jgi:hypothetical protein
MTEYRTVPIPDSGRKPLTPRRQLILAVIDASARGEAIVIPPGEASPALHSTLWTALRSRGYSLHSRRRKEDGGRQFFWCTPIPTSDK